MSIKKSLKALITFALLPSHATPHIAARICARAMTILLALALLLSLATACAVSPAEPPAPPSDGDDAQQVSAAPSDAAQISAPELDTRVLYSEQKLPIPFEADALACPAARHFYAYANGRIYYEKNIDVRDDAGTVIAQRMEIYSVDTDGHDARLEWSLSAPFDAQAEAPEFAAIACFGVDDDDNLWVCVERATEDTSGGSTPMVRSFELIKRAPNGTQILSRELPSELALARVRNIQFDGDGNVYLRTAAVGSDGMPTWAIRVFAAESAEYLFASPTGAMLTTFAPTRNGTMVLRTQNSEASYSFVYIPFDVATQTMGTSLPAEDYRNFQTMYRGDGEWDIYHGDDDFSTTPYTSAAIYGLNLSTGEDALIIDLAASDILVEMALIGIYRISDAEFLIGKMGDGLYKLTRDSDKGGAERVEVTLGTVAYDPALVTAAQKFNATNADLRVVIKDYSVGTDAAGAVTALDLDILNGRAPDIISLASLSAAKYASKGVLADMNALINDDASIDRADLFESILALGEVDGKLYHIIPHFIPSLLSGKASLFGTDGTTLAEFNDVLAQHPSAIAALEYSAASWVTTWTAYMLDELINWQSGTCDFDGEQFVALLSSAKRFPNEVDYTQFAAADDIEMRYLDYLEKIRNNEILLSYSMLLELRDVRALRAVFGDDGAYLGFPTTNGAGTAVYADFDLGITAASDKKEAAWEFISFLINSDFTATMPGFSISRAAFERAAEAESVPFGERDFTQGVRLAFCAGLFTQYRTVSADDLTADEKASYPLTDEEIATARELIEIVTTSLSNEAIVSAIVAEEAAAFLGGARSAEETARIIQSRVGLYVAEQGEGRTPQKAS